MQSKLSLFRRVEILRVIGRHLTEQVENKDDNCDPFENLKRIFIYSPLAPTAMGQRRRCSEAALTDFQIKRLFLIRQAPPNMIPLCVCLYHYMLLAGQHALDASVGLEWNMLQEASNVVRFYLYRVYSFIQPSYRQLKYSE